MQQIYDFLNLLGVEWPKFLAQLVVFVTVYLVLRRFAFRPILAVLEERRRRIEESQANVEKIRKQLDDAEKRYQQILDEAGVRAQRLIDEAKASGGELAERKKQEAIAEAQKIVERAREATALERDQMMGDLKSEVARLVVQTTARVAGKVLSAEDQKRLSEEAAREVAA
jgi:F-type H+-transporting ATPase subunit b